MAGPVGDLGVAAPVSRYNIQVVLLSCTRNKPARNFEAFSVYSEYYTPLYRLHVPLYTSYLMQVLSWMLWNPPAIIALSLELKAASMV